MKPASIYPDVKAKLKTAELFENVKIIVPIMPNFEFDDTSDQVAYSCASTYRILPLRCQYDDKNLSGLGELVNDIVNEINSNVNKEQSEKVLEWNLFYLYKELIQKLLNIKEFNYYRGQSDNWPLQPGIFRDSTFCEEFESNYKELAEEYPEDLRYFTYLESRDERATELGILQHYGLKTSLVDVSENPFISMMFMLDNKKRVAEDMSYTDSSYNKFGSKSLDLFAIDRDKDSEFNIFTTVKHKKINKRLTAQRGAFLFYDKLYDLSVGDIHKIPRVTIELELQKCYAIDILNEKIELFNEAIKNIRQSIDSDEYSEGVDNRNKKSTSIELLVTELFDNVKNFERHINDLRNGGILTYNIMEEIEGNIKTKLEEYHYRQKNLFPDFVDQIGYIQQKYIK